jgi:hypothetical protein
MILTTGDTTQAYQRLWQCLGCGREVLADSDEQRHDDWLREHLALAGSPQRDRLF